MVVSTRGRYALRVMIDLAKQNNASYTPLRDIARRALPDSAHVEKAGPYHQ
ncbi:Rrf2 family transcriptional regulator [Fusobacterium naviforme]|nr:Rrf2 family transcriptional regulator [Fusobacterium naviforme]